MDVSKRRAEVKSSVVAGSVWESRMTLDEVKAGIKVFNGEQNPEANRDGGQKLVPAKKLGQTSVATSGKRKTWKSESCDGPIQIAKGKTCKEQSRELSVSADGIKKSPIQRRKGRSEGGKELSSSVDGIDKSPIQGKNGRSLEGNKEVKVSVDGIAKTPIQVKKGRSEASKEACVSVDENEKNPVQIKKSRSDIKEVVDESDVQLRKVKSDSVEVTNQAGKDVVVDDGIERNSVQLMKAKSEPGKVLDNSVPCSDESVSGIEKNPPEVEETKPEESCKEFGVCQEKVISNSESNEEIIKPPPKMLVDNPSNGDDGEEDDVVVNDGDEEFEEEIEIEIEKKSVDVKENKIPEEKPKEVETKNVAEQKPKKVNSIIPEQKLRKVVNEEKRVHNFGNKSTPTSSTVDKQPPPVLRRSTIYQNLTKPTPSIPVDNGYQSFPETHSKLQNLVDLVMWRDISRSAFVFGTGTFIIISSSYTQDLNVSFISVISYLGLVYLAAIFLYRSLICRGVVDVDDDRNYVVGDGEAIWLLKLVLPYLNEFLLKIRALFSGDPSTTMKMAVLLFVFARCGSSVTVWKMAKLGFFGVFTVPKVCSSYSEQLTAYGKFWVRRFKDAWDTCSHKKAVALAVFTLVWNLSSMVARVWAAFMMFVAFRYYQQSMERDGWAEEEDGNDAAVDEKWHGHGHGHIGGQSQRQGAGPTVVELNKVKKGS